ncbi:MAG: penicillin-binding protein 2 [Candidatus Gracilibacteria bacterium]|jgi:stage V sporulation protein D (sporulation-specific penicillin-binding protein)
MMNYARTTRKGPSINKVTFLIVGSAFIAIILVGRLFNLQVIQHQYYQDLATREQGGYTELPAQRGGIIMKDLSSKEEYFVATNTTLNLLYADPSLITDPAYVADKIAPLIFDINENREKDNQRILDQSKKLPADITEEEKTKLLTPLTDEELKTNFRTNFITLISAKQRNEILLGADLTKVNLDEIAALNLPGIKILDNDVYAYPALIVSTKTAAEKLSEPLEIPTAKLSKILKGLNRYVVIKRKLQPEISKKIKEILTKDKDGLMIGIGMTEEYFRLYPEGSLAASIIGYVDNNNTGQYGIESSFNTALQGIAGKFETKKDSLGRQITVGESILKSAQNGDDIVLTIDRSIQMKVEEVLENTAKSSNSDSGQAIVMNPKTGAIIAIANYPYFDPNKYGDVFRKTEVTFTPEEIATKLIPTKDEGIYYLYKDEISLVKYTIFAEKDANENVHYFRYENYWGPEVYHNKVVAWPYEPGSVFKPIVMAMAIDDGDVTPNTTYNDTGPVGVDFNKYTQKYDYEIKNATGYYGLVDMKTVLAKSLNTGMTFVSKKIGPGLFYSYLEKFGFLDRTDIELDNEGLGKIAYFEDWTESELATHAFGQGLTVTLLQLVNGYSTIANGGVLMQPYIVEEVRHGDGTVSTTEPHEIRRVISEDTAAKMTAMLINVVEKGFQEIHIPNHYFAGKSGTAQTYKHGIALFGVGSTVVTFAGYGPVNNPQFVIAVKLDHPRSSEWSTTTSGPAVSEIAKFLYDYYNIPPDK